MKMHIARFISFIFGPIFWVIFLFAATYYKDLFKNKNDMMIVIVISCIIPLMAFAALLRSGKISDLDITVRKERYSMLVIINICMLALLVFLRMRYMNVLFHLTQIVYVIVTISSLITLFYKISLHVTFSYTFAVLINAVFSFKLWYLYLIVPTVFWSRLALKKHTMMQMLLAICIDSIIIYVMW